MHLLKIHFFGCLNAVGCVKNDTKLGAYTKCRQFSQLIAMNLYMKESYEPLQRFTLKCATLKIYEAFYESKQREITHYSCRRVQLRYLSLKYLQASTII